MTSDSELKAQVKQRLADIRTGMVKRLDRRVNGRKLVKFMSREVDSLLLDLWRQLSGPVCDCLDLVAIGGYGRAELCPYSDWDLLFLLRDHNNDDVNRAIERMLYVLWDIGAQIGHAARTPAETLEHAKADLHARTALMESRLLSGPGDLYAQLQQKAHESWSKRLRKQFCEQKMAEFAERRQAMGDTAFLMEPDVKNGKGGLRDISTMFWLAMGWYGVPKARELIATGEVSEKEFNAFIHARNFLWRVRSGLHLHSNREDDRLRFEYQQVLARRFGYRDTGGMQAVERFMKVYFRHARAVADLADTFLLHFDEQLHPKRLRRSHDIGHGMVVRASKVGIGDEQTFASDPMNLLRIFAEAQKEHRYLDSRALRVIRAHAQLVDAGLRKSRQANSMFLDLLRSRRNVATILRQMHETGVLGRFVPDIGRIAAHGQFDRYHAYTVDEHTIRAVDVLRDFRLDEGQFIRMPMATSLMQAVHRPELLYLAMIFHDIAKGRDGDHSEIGAILARRFCRRLRLSRDETELVAWLVLHHLAMSQTSQRFDISDSDVIADFASLVGGRERLEYLFLLTVADITAVGPGVWTDWKGALLTELFDLTLACLRSGQVQAVDRMQRVADRKDSVLGMCRPEEKKGVSRVLENLPYACALHFPPMPLLRLSRLLSSGNADCGTHADVDEERGYTTVLAWGNDVPGLFARLTSALAGVHAQVLAARAYSLLDGRALDEFHLITSTGKPIREPNDIERLLTRLQQALAGSEPRRSYKPPQADVLMQSLPVTVKRLDRASAQLTTIEVTAASRPGLLTDLAMAIADMDLDLRGANISTFGEQAVDVFFIADGEGNRLDDEQTERVIGNLQKAAELKPAEAVHA